MTEDEIVAAFRVRGTGYIAASLIQLQRHHVAAPAILPPSSPHS